MRRMFTIKGRRHLTIGVVGVLLAAVAGAAFWGTGTVRSQAQDVRTGTLLSAAMTRVAGIVGDLVRHERTYFLDASWERDTAADLQRWNEAVGEAGKRVKAIEALGDGREA